MLDDDIQSIQIQYYEYYVKAYLSQSWSYNIMLIISISLAFCGQKCYGRRLAEVWT